MLQSISSFAGLVHARHLLPALAHGLRTAAVAGGTATQQVMGQQQAQRPVQRQFADKVKEQQQQEGAGSQWEWMVSQGHKVSHRLLQ